MPIDNQCERTIRNLVNLMDATVNGEISYKYSSLQEITPEMDEDDRNNITRTFNKFLEYNEELQEVIQRCKD